MRLPDKPQAAGLVPEVAEGPPKVSANGKTYVFTIRKGVRFSTGSPVTARDVAHTINRILDKRFQSPLASQFSDIVGADVVIAGKAATASGIVARGDTLAIRLTKPLGDFTARTSYLCVVPAAVPPDPEGVRAPVPTPAPYYIAEYVPNDHVVLLRNRFYRGTRPHHIDRFDIDLSADAQTILDRVDKNQLDYAWAPNMEYAVRAGDFAKRYGINKSRFFTSPGTFLRMFALNTSRPLFKDNLALRRAVNFAVDRHALLVERGFLAGRLTAQYLWPGMLGFKDASIYPLKAPNLKKARKLARGHTRAGKAVLYVPTLPSASAQAQILSFDLKKIGINVEVKAFPPLLLFDKLATRGEPFDIGWIGWAIPGDRDGAFFLDSLFDGRTIGQPGFGNYSYFNSAKYNTLLQRDERLTGPARARAFGALDADISRNAAPAIPYAYDNTMNLVSSRTGCAVFNPYLDLAAVCLK
jgi:peptide/nickel transport system substrate-binding protein